MHYQVIARRWRPQNFQEVVGQPHVVKTLTRAIQKDRIAHAYLFSGPRGVGKTSVARILAKALNCIEGPTPYPCCRCGPCLEIAQGSFIDVLEMDAASNRGIDEIRGLRENVRYAPAQGRYKAYIIDEVHMLTEAAFNALLKTLEEPPPHVVFVLATTEAKRIPPTILSRCQHFQFRALSPQDMKDVLRRIVKSEGLELEEEALELLIRASDGSLRDGEMILEQLLASGEGGVTREDVAQLLGLVEKGVVEEAFRRMKAGETEDLIRMFQEEVIGGGYDAYGFVEELVRVVRKELVGQLTLLGDKERLRLYTIMDILMRLLERMRRHPLPELLAEMELVRITALPPLSSISELVSRLERLERAGGPSKIGSARERAKGQVIGEDALVKELRKRLMKERPSLGPLLNRCHIYFQRNSLVIESGALTEFERANLEEEETLEVIKHFLSERGVSAQLKLRWDGEEVTQESEREVEEEVLSDPRIRRALGLFRGKVVCVVDSRGE